MNRSKVLTIGGVIGLILAVAIGVSFFAAGSGKPVRSPTTSPRAPANAAQEKAQVEQAYLRFWEAWTKANQTLDTAVLRTGMAGPALDQAEGLIEELKAKNEPVKVMVEHNYKIYFPREGSASVDDTFVDRSVRLDPETGAAKGSQANETIRNSYTLKKVAGKWKVVEIIGYRSPSP